MLMGADSMALSSTIIVGDWTIASDNRFVLRDLAQYIIKLAKTKWRETSMSVLWTSISQENQRKIIR